MAPTTRRTKKVIPPKKYSRLAKSSKLPPVKVICRKNKKLPAVKKASPTAKKSKAPPIDTPKLSTDDAVTVALYRYSLGPDKKYAGVTKHSAKHDERRRKYENEYKASIIGSQRKFVGVLADMTTGLDGKLIPNIFMVCGGEKTLQKRKLVGKSVFNWISTKKPTRGSGLDLEPNTMMTYLRTFFGHMKDTYDWRYNLDTDFGFEGGLVPCLNKLFNDRREKSGQCYGTGFKRAQLNGVTSVTELNLDVFDDEDPVQHMQQMLAVYGAYYGLRGSGEHVTLTVRNIERGFFESEHAWGGEEFWSLHNMSDKTFKLSTTNTILRRKVESRIPLNSIPGRVITKFMNKISPGQVRIYCKPASFNQRKHFASLGYPNSAFSPSQPIGVNGIRKMMKAALAKLGHPDCTGHGFRRLFITTLANDSGVSIAEAMQSARHASVAAQAAYITRDNVSETAKFKALGMNVKKRAV